MIIIIYFYHLRKTKTKLQKNIANARGKVMKLGDILI